MKLISLHIDGFGKLNDFSFNFSDELNCIEAENCYGKTTLAAFIRAMLYGLKSNSTRGKVCDNDRRHYAPWGGGVFGGSLDIGTTLGNFRIYRSFGLKSSDDTFSLLNLDTGLKCNDYSENLGVELFGIDAETYDKSTYIPQRDVDMSMSPDIVAKLTGLLQSDDDIADFDKATARLDGYIKKFRLLRGDSGQIHDSENELAECLTGIEKCKKSLAEAELKKAGLEQRGKFIAQCDSEQSVIRKKLDEVGILKQKQNEYDILCEHRREAERAEARLRRYEDLFPNGIPEVGELDEITVLCAQADSTANDIRDLSAAETAELENLNRRFGDKPLDQSEINAYTEKAAVLSGLVSGLNGKQPPEKPPESKEKPTVFRAIIIAGLSGVLTGLALLITGAILHSIPLLITGITVALLCGTAAAFGFIRNMAIRKAAVGYAEAREKYNSEFDSYNTLCRRVELERASLEAALGRYYPGCPGGIDAVLGRLDADTERYALLQKARKDAEAQSAARRAEIVSLFGRIDAFFTHYGFQCEDGYSPALIRVRDNMRALAVAKEDAAERRKVAEKFATDKGIDGEPPVIPDTHSDEQRLEELRRQAGLLREEAGSLARSVEMLEEQAEQLPDLRDKAESLRERIADYEANRRTAEMAKALLKRAKDNLSSRYLRDMENSFKKNYTDFCGTGAPDTVIGANLGISFRETGGQREPEWYSNGQQSTISVCLRLALTDALFIDEKPFLILDDPFTELDGNRLENAKNMIRSLSRERQILYFTCHQSRKIE